MTRALTQICPAGADDANCGGFPEGGSRAFANPFKDKLRSGIAPKDEHGAQVKLLAEARRRGVAGLRWFAVPNAARRSMNLAAKMRAEGMKAGVADLVFIAPPHGRAFFLEMKKEKGGRRSDAQLLFAREIKEAGASHEFADGFAQAVAILEGWGLLRP
jgi:hypothetical protein